MREFSVYPDVENTCQRDKNGKTSEKCIHVFVIDSGVNVKHSFYRDLVNRGIRPQWLWGFDRDSSSYGQQKDISSMAHGTCVASLAVSSSLPSSLCITYIPSL